MSSADNHRRQAAVLAKVYRGDYRALQRDASQAASDARKPSVTVEELLDWRNERLKTGAPVSELRTAPKLAPEAAE